MNDLLLAYEEQLKERVEFFSALSQRTRKQGLLPSVISNGNIDRGFRTHYSEFYLRLVSFKNTWNSVLGLLYDEDVISRLASRVSVYSDELEKLSKKRIYKSNYTKVNAVIMFTVYTYTYSMAIKEIKEILGE